MERISRQQMLAEMVITAAKRSTCLRKQVGALIAIEGRVLSIGYGGSPSGTPHCMDAGCIIGPDGGCLRTIHAEQNVIAFAARNGIAIRGAELWCSMTPCLPCAKLIINSGIKSVFALEEYRDAVGINLLIQVGIDVRIFGAPKS